MKKIIYYTVLILAILFTACTEKVDYVNPDWARPIFPEEGGTVKIDFFKPDDIQAFTWEVRPNSTYKIYFDTDMHFEDSYVFDMGTTDSLKIKNQDFLEILRSVWPDFASIKRFFWKVEQNTNGDVKTSWRYFDAILAVENFKDPRDGENYEARQFVMKDGSLMTIMAENLRAKVYSNGSELPIPYKTAITNDPVFEYKAGHFYTWATAVNMTWDDAKTAALANQAVQGICPDGWHLPSKTELDKFSEYMGVYVGANLIKDPSYWFTTTNITNSSKMNIVASGYYWNENSDVMSNSLDSDYPIAMFWSSTPYLKGMQLSWETSLDDDPQRAILMSLWDDSEAIVIQGYGIVPSAENRLFPIRCIMDEVK